MDQPLAGIYRDHELLKDIRAARFTGRCALAEDPAGPYVPEAAGQR